MLSTLRPLRGCYNCPYRKNNGHKDRRVSQYELPADIPLWLPIVGTETVVPPETFDVFHWSGMCFFELDIPQLIPSYPWWLSEIVHESVKIITHHSIFKGNGQNTVYLDIISTINIWVCLKTWCTQKTKYNR